MARDEWAVFEAHRVTSIRVNDYIQNGVSQPKGKWPVWAVNMQQVLVGGSSPGGITVDSAGVRYNSGPVGPRRQVGNTWKQPMMTVRMGATTEEIAAASGQRLYNRHDGKGKTPDPFGLACTR